MNRYAARELVTNSQEVSRSARLLYLKLDEHAREKGFCYLKHATLMTCLKCSKRSLQNWFTELVQAGLCSIERSTTGGVNRYHMIHEFSTNVRNEAQLAARGGATDCMGGCNPLRPHIRKLNTSFETVNPLPPSSEQKQNQPQPQKPGSLEGWAPYEEKEPEPPAIDPGMCTSCSGTGMGGWGSGKSTCGTCLGSGRCETIRRRA